MLHAGKKAIKYTSFFIVLLLLLQFGCTNSDANLQQFSSSFFCMDTVVSMDITAKKDISHELQNLGADLENELSVSIATSSISQINQNNDTRSSISGHAKEVINLAHIYNTKTDGAFDYTLGRPIALWENARLHKIVPAENIVIEELNASGVSNITNDGRNIQLNNGVQINLGAIGKGYYADLIAEKLQEVSVESGLISLGGSSIIIKGYKNTEENTPWEIGLADVDDPQDYFGTLKLHDCFVSMSGDYQKFFIDSDIRYHHILDPNTGYPVDNGIREVTVISDTGAKGDAYSTALFVMGLEKGKEFYERENDFEAVFVTSGKEVYITSGLESIFSFDGNNIGYTFKGVL